MFKFLKEVVAGSGTGLKDFPYNIENPYSSDWGSWTHYRGTSKDDGSLVSIFSLSGSNPQDGLLAAGRNGVKRLRTVRHPNILSFLHSTEAETFDGSSNKHTIYLVTEPVMPLSEKIKELGLEGIQRNEYYAWGLHQIAKAVSFLNNDCKLVHGNVCMASVVVTQTLDWKLHAFDVLTEFDGHNEASTVPLLFGYGLIQPICSPSQGFMKDPLEQFEWLVGSQYKSQELRKSDWSTIRKSPPWAIDSWGLGCLIYELFSGKMLSKCEELGNTASIPKSLLPDYQTLLTVNPSRRLNSSKLIENSEYFHNKLVETIKFMEVLNLKDSVEKDAFFRKLPSLAEQLPRQIVLKKLIPLLASALEFGSATALALTAILKMGSWFSPEEFNEKVLTTVVKLYASTDRGIRISLLQHIDQYGESLSAQVVDEQIFPHVATGFSDLSGFLRELTLKSMLILAPKLSQRTISGTLLKYLSKLQVDEEPAIRANTTILLGNIASYFNEGTRKRVLINAFTVRALRDTFAPARAAGIMALCSTSLYYDMTEIATRVLPNIVVLTVDPDGDVRTKAFEAIDQFLAIARQYHEQIATGETGESVGTGLPGLPGNASLLGWAMSSLVSKGKVSEHPTIASENMNSTLVSVPPISSSVFDAAPNIAPVQASCALDSADQPVPSSPTSTDGWGEIENGIHEEENDKDAWDELEPLEEHKPSPAVAIIQAAQKWPDVQPNQQVSNLPKPSKGDDLWDAIEAPAPKSLSRPQTAKTSTSSTAQGDDLWGSIAAPVPKSASKPLNVRSSANNNDDPWAAIAAPLPTSKVKPLSLGRGRGTKPAPAKLGAQRINRTTSSGVL